jgi:carboxypeptidase C (cathepsin A)
MKMAAAGKAPGYNLSFTHYPSGHMFYLDNASLEQFRQDAEAWYAK